MNNLEFLKYIDKIINSEKPKELRNGQWLYTVLHETYPEIARKIKNDPFYVDKVISEFIKELLNLS